MRRWSLLTQSMLIGVVMVVIALVFTMYIADRLERKATQSEDTYTPPEPPRQFSK
jgi:galactitol-specific phosphotransferase system IIC component